MRNFLSYAAAMAAIAAAVSPLALAEPVNVTLSKRDAVVTRFESGAVRNGDRQSTLEASFHAVGCAPATLSVTKSTANVMCTLPGEDAETIIVGAHFDFVERGQGMVDNWSGAALLPSLYETLKSELLHHTFRFVGFAGEEQGLAGSTRYVKELNATERTNLRAYINLECLGLSPVSVWASRADPVLLRRWTEIAGALKMPVAAVNVEQVGDDDSHPFLRAKVPVITIHSLTQETLPLLHTRRDQAAAVDMNRYYDAYRAVAFYLRYLDDKLRERPVLSSGSGQ